MYAVLSQPLKSGIKSAPIRKMNCGGIIILIVVVLFTFHQGT